MTSNKFLLILLILICQNLFADERQGEVKVARITAEGTGCTNGSVSSNFSPDLKEFSILFDNFIATSGAQSGATLDRKNCNVHLQIKMHENWQFALATADYRGFVALEDGTQATHKVIYQMNKNRGEKSLNQSVFKGPLIDGYTIQHSVNSGELEWTECKNKNLNLKIKVDLIAQSINPRASNNGAQITLDSLDGAVAEQKFGILWRKCDSKKIKNNNKF